MKKMIISIMTTVCVMTVVGGAYIAEVKDDYETKLAETTASYEECIDELEETVYNMKKGNPYDITFDYEDSTYRFVSN